MSPERMFVDYAGTTLAALGASSFTYAEATYSQGLSEWIGSHTRSFALIGEAPMTVVWTIRARASPRPVSTSRRSTASGPRPQPTIIPPCAGPPLYRRKAKVRVGGVRLAPLHPGKPRSYRGSYVRHSSSAGTVLSRNHARGGAFWRSAERACGGGPSRLFGVRPLAVQHVWS
jgi:hypothetical protein